MRRSRGQGRRSTKDSHSNSQNGLRIQWVIRTMVRFGCIRKLLTEFLDCSSLCLGMSEYQYYEFQTVDRRLTQQQMRELRAYSTRARITPTSFVNEYDFGNFKGNPDAWMEKYFDGYLYFANWGTRELQLAVPAKLLEKETVRRYCSTPAASTREKSGKCILTFCLEEESGGDWLDDEGSLSTLLQIRSELARGDLRALYLGWLLSVEAGEVDDSEVEPRVPPNLDDLSSAQETFAFFFHLDPDLLSEAARHSPRTEQETSNRKEAASWIKSLPPLEKDEMLVRLLAGETNIGMDLQARFHQLRNSSQTTGSLKLRTVGELLAAAETHRAERLQEHQRLADLEKARRDRNAAIAREKHLDSLKGKTDETWAAVATLVATRQPKSYDLAVQHLKDLCELATDENNRAIFMKRFERLRNDHSSKKSFIDRLTKAGLALQWSFAEQPLRLSESAKGDRSRPLAGK
jgi:hypothetical protein